MLDEFGKMGVAFIVIWSLSFIMSLAFIGVVIWGVIELVQWVTAK